MKGFCGEVLEAAAAGGVHVEQLSPGEAKAIFSGVVAKFTDNASPYPRWLWEHLLDVGGYGLAYYQDPQAWELVGPLTDNSVPILFFNQHDETVMLKFANGSDLGRVLGETTNFEFYVTNPVLDYLLCVNHHDVLYAAGMAAPQLRGIMAQHAEEAAHPKPYDEGGI